MGKPSAGNAASPRPEYIGPAEASQGTETSQYLEERKSTETPRVVASERGTAQTRQVQACRRCLLGVAGRPSGCCIARRELPSRVLAEAPGTAHQRGEPSRRRKRSGLPRSFLSR